MNEMRVVVGGQALGELIALARLAATHLQITDAPLADALTGCAAEVELTIYAADDKVCC